MLELRSYNPHDFHATLNFLRGFDDSAGGIRSAME
jgi:hypothetical protein